MDYTKGILRRLEAIELFLATAPDRDAVKFIFISVPSRGGVEEYQDLRAEVEARVGRINGRYATIRSSPIRFIHDSVDFIDLVALYASADVALVTPLIDGMNLVAKEFIACQREHNGVLILSEFAGAAEELSNALLVNPYDPQAVAETLAAALALPEEERRASNQPMRERVLKYDAQHWARTFIQQLNTPEAAAGATPSNAGEALGRLRESLADGDEVALFLDYDGTLREIEREPRAARPSPEIRELLRQLSARENVDLTLISGRSREDLSEWFSEERFAIIAEHGAAVRRAKRRDWEQWDRDINYGWKDEIREVLRLYEQSTPGSRVEEKRTSLVWHYRSTDPEFGTWKANQLAHELGIMTAHEPVRIRQGRKIVEVTAAGISKGAAVRRLLQEKRSDLVVCAGDDQTDESMLEMEADNLISIKVGPEPSRAHFRIRDPAELRKFLRDALASAETGSERKD